MKTLTRWAIERPRMVLAAWLLLLAAAVPFALQLEGGLKAGDTVITEGQLRVMPGKPVAIQGKHGGHRSAARK